MKFLLRLAASAVAACASAAAQAWIYPEHRDIAVLAVQGLDTARRAQLEQLWQRARTGNEQRLCAVPADAGQGVTPACIDWAALPAIAGDHSCSAADLQATVLDAAWILQVADVAAQLKLDLARIPVTATAEQLDGPQSAFADAKRRFADETSRAARQNALRTADTRMQRADPHYATRADANLAHFVMARPGTSLDPDEHSRLSYGPGIELNAGGVYAWYHLSALDKASKLANEPGLTEAERSTLVRSMLLDEAFAAHFLEDMFAAGHVAGSWGDVSQRKGTHDFYNQNGLEAFTWTGRDRTLVLMGDAHMRPEDAAMVAESVRASLEQVLDAAAGRQRGSHPLPYTPGISLQPEAFDVCRSKVFIARAAPPVAAGPPPYRESLREVLLPTPVPGLAHGLGALPRSRSEVGPFMGLAGSIDVRGSQGGLLAGQTSWGAIAGLDLSFRAGIGLEGALGDSGDGIVFAQFGLRGDSPSSNKYSDTGLGARLEGNLAAAIPAESGPSLRVRMPYYLVPFDLLFLSPLYLVNPDLYTGMAISAVNGGLLNLQQGIATPIGRFQFVLGREVGVAWYGLSGNNQVLVPTQLFNGLPAIMNVKSTYIDLPILEYRPFRSYSHNQSSSVIFQLFGGLQIPYDAHMVNEGFPLPELRNVWSVGLRMVFDWRYYR